MPVTIHSIIKEANCQKANKLTDTSKSSRWRILPGSRYVWICLKSTSQGDILKRRIVREIAFIAALYCSATQCSSIVCNIGIDEGGSLKRITRMFCKNILILMQIQYFRSFNLNIYFFTVMREQQYIYWVHIWILFRPAKEKKYLKWGCTVINYNPWQILVISETHNQSKKCISYWRFLCTLHVKCRM